jgi:putative thioredoxin
MQADSLDFQADVVEASRTRPVLVDFWAPWCGPCRVLGPTLDRLAAEAGDRWKLVKVNTDEHPALMQQFGIRGIPAVKLFAHGQVIDEFTGALPDYAVRQWLEKALPSENKKRLDAARRALDEDHDPASAEPILREILAGEPEMPEARVLLARIIALRDPGEAERLVDTAAFAGPSAVQVQEAVRTIARLHGLDPGDLPDDPAREPYLGAVAALRQGTLDEALQGFIDALSRHRDFDDDGPRKACVAIFTLLGEQHELVKKHSRAFGMALW